MSILNEITIDFDLDCKVLCDTPAKLKLRNKTLTGINYNLDNIDNIISTREYVLLLSLLRDATDMWKCIILPVHSSVIFHILNENKYHSWLLHTNYKYYFHPIHDLLLVTYLIFHHN